MFFSALFRRLFRRKPEFLSSEELAKAIKAELNARGYAPVWFTSVEVVEEVFSLLPSGSFEIISIRLDGEYPVEVEFLSTEVSSQELFYFSIFACSPQAFSQENYPIVELGAQIRYTIRPKYERQRFWHLVTKTVLFIAHF